MGRNSKLWVAALALAVVLAGGDALAKKPGGNTTPLDILISIDRELYAIQDDGTGQTYLAPDWGGHTWSPDGTQVAFYSDGMPEGYGIYVMDLATGTSELLIPMSGYSAGWLDWCPVLDADGMHRLAFTMRNASTNETPDVFVARFDDQGLLAYENVTKTPGTEQDLTWSPTGDQIAVDYYNEIRVLDLANLDTETDLPTAHTVYSSTEIRPNYPTWAKTGNRIAFSASDTNAFYPRNDIYIFVVSQDARTSDWTGSTPVNLTNTPNDEENGTLSWSPDDSLIVCLSVYWRQFGKGSGKASLQLIDSVTGNRSKLADRWGVHPAWRRGSD